MMDGYDFGAAVAVGANMRDQDRAMAQWQRAVQERDVVIVEMEARQRELEAELLKLVGQSQADAAAIAGLNAYIKTVQQKSPNCEALKPTGERYGDGKVVTVAGREYMRAYDAKAIELGRSDLAEVRVERDKAAA